MKSATDLESVAWRATLRILGSGLLPIALGREVVVFGFTQRGVGMSSHRYRGRAAREIAAWLTAQAARVDT